MNEAKWLAVVPRDGYFFNDGRGWNTAAGERGHGLSWPFPSTIAGALRSAVGRSRESTGGEAGWNAIEQDVALGLALPMRRQRGGDWEWMWPAPADAIAVDNERKPVQPKRSSSNTMGRDDDSAREALWHPRVETKGKMASDATRWWSADVFLDWLLGKYTRPGAPTAMLRRTQTRVSIDAESQTSGAHALFEYDVVETYSCDEEWGIGVEAQSRGPLPSGFVDIPWTLGSDRRLAHAEMLTRNPSTAPRQIQDSTWPGIRLFVVTPACFDRGWVPDGFEVLNDAYTGMVAEVGPMILRAAIVGRPLHVSGWNMQERRPKNTTRLVPAGSVYYLQKQSGEPFSSAELARMWLYAIGDRTKEGFGRVVPGLWSPRENLA